MTPITLIMAGQEAGGDAGFQANPKAITTLRVHGARAITALTAQTTRAATMVAAASPAMIAARMPSSVPRGRAPCPSAAPSRTMQPPLRQSRARCDNAPEPAPTADLHRPAPDRPTDRPIDLRAAAPPFDAAAHQVPPEAIATLHPPAGSRVVPTCATGLCAHNAGQTLRAPWPGEIALHSLNL